MSIQTNRHYRIINNKKVNQVRINKQLTPCKHKT